jgi:hypothetical protein
MGKSAAAHLVVMHVGMKVSLNNSLTLLCRGLRSSWFTSEVEVDEASSGVFHRCSYIALREGYNTCPL